MPTRHLYAAGFGGVFNSFSVGQYTHVNNTDYWQGLNDIGLAVVGDISPTPDTSSYVQRTGVTQGYLIQCDGDLPSNAIVTQLRVRAYTQKNTNFGSLIFHYAMGGGGSVSAGTSSTTSYVANTWAWQESEVINGSWTADQINEMRAGWSFSYNYEQIVLVATVEVFIASYYLVEPNIADNMVVSEEVNPPVDSSFEVNLDANAVVKLKHSRSLQPTTPAFVGLRGSIEDAAGTYLWAALGGLSGVSLVLNPGEASEASYSLTNAGAGGYVHIVSYDSISYGSSDESSIKVGADPGGFIFRSLFQFDISAFAVAITGAKLVFTYGGMNFSNYPANGTVHAVALVSDDPRNLLTDQQLYEALGVEGEVGAPSNYDIALMLGAHF